MSAIADQLEAEKKRIMAEHIGKVNMTWSLLTLLFKLGLDRNSNSLIMGLTINASHDVNSFVSRLTRARKI